MDRKNEFLRDMMKAFEDLPPDAFAEFRPYATELGVQIETLCLIACKEYVRERRRRRQRKE